MTIIDTTLYANGALRLTDHGPRGGGLVLVHTRTNGRTEQVSVPYADRERVERFCAAHTAPHAFECVKAHVERRALA